MTIAAPSNPGSQQTPDRSETYDPAAVEAKWQARWRERATNATDLAGGQSPFYALMMFPYPSAEGLHVGNLFAFTGNDILARFRRMQGETVFEPLGFDAFGIHSENYALKVGIHPAELIPRNIANFRRQLERAGLMIDWRYSVDTTDPHYYRWTQWIFLQLYKLGLAKKRQAPVNWCPFDKTVLANEQVIAGACERCGTKVEQRFLEQWFFSISSFAPRLLANLDRLDWSETTKTAQRNWIGRSEGARILFDVGGADVPVFTTRPDTVFGATFLVLAPEHPLVDAVTTDAQRATVDAYRRRTVEQDVVSRQLIDKDKTGVFTGGYAVNPATGERIPVWIADYVLMSYGYGAIMGVPAHDDRDLAFAQTHELLVVPVIDDDGRLIRSGAFDGLGVVEGASRIVAWLGERGRGGAEERYRLHDWCISRQRYWGPPIPIIYCDACGTVPVPESDLPVRLPHLEDIRPDDSGVSPLARDEAWYRVTCPACGGPARRETDVSDTFLDSAWYFLRYPSADRDDVPFDAELTRKWLPVRSYIGGNEHAVLHLLYARFITMVLHDAGLIGFEEPFTRFRAHGHIVRDGAKMSKSRGNVVNPDQYFGTWGADAFRTYLMFLGPYEQGGDFRDNGIAGTRRFLERVWASVSECTSDGAPDPGVLGALHRMVRKVTDDLPRLSYNTAIAAMMEYLNVLRSGERTPHREETEPLIRLVAPVAPHIAEELWERIGGTGSVFDGGWPTYDLALATDATVTIAIQVNGKLRSTVQIAPDASQDAVYAAAIADPAVARHLSGAGTPKKVVYIPGRLLNVVT
jgi:leucyl-tRNA synthetase